MDRVIHVRLVRHGDDVVELRHWTTNENQAENRNLRLSEISGLLSAAESDYYSPQLPRLVEVGKRLYRWLDGDERWLAKRRDQLAGSAPVALAIQLVDGLGHLPWETLHDETGFLILAANPPVVPVRCRQPGKTIGRQQPVNRALNVVFMATSPIGSAGIDELGFEAEEAEILDATKRFGLGLHVEETGNLDELKILLQQFGDDRVDVVHLTGHADHRGNVPIFITEDEVGNRVDSTTSDIAEAIATNPPIVFLSGCRTGQNPSAATTRSLAEGLIEKGLQSVLGWGRKVRDSDATFGARELYRSLSAGESLVKAVRDAVAAMHKANLRDWHLLRVYSAAAPVGPFVTAPKTPKRALAPQVSFSRWFIDASGQKKVAGRQEFVGRRRYLQRILRRLRTPEPNQLGVLTQGMGGVGKSSLAARLCDRLEGQFDFVFLIGRLEETRLLAAIEPLMGTDGTLRAMLQGTDAPLHARLAEWLRMRNDAGLKPVLFILDDFEQNMEKPQDGTPPRFCSGTEWHPATIFKDFATALQQDGRSQCIVTCRYPIPGYGDELPIEQLFALEKTALTKKLRNLEREYPTTDEKLREHAARVGDGNPRLLERLFQVISLPGLKHEEILQKVEAKTDEFREHTLAAELLKCLTEVDRRVLATLLVFELPVPFAVAEALFTSGELVVDSSELRRTLQNASGFGLVEFGPSDDQIESVRVPRILEALLEESRPKDVNAVGKAAAIALHAAWWKVRPTLTELQSVEILRLSLMYKVAESGLEVAEVLLNQWLQKHRYVEVHSFAKRAIDAFGEDYRLLRPYGQALLVLGSGDEAVDALRRAAVATPIFDPESYAKSWYELAVALVGRGDLDESLRILRDKALPLYEKLGDVRSRAVTLGQISDVLEARGELDEALRIRREEELPVYEKLGDVRSRAVTLGQIADVLEARGELDEALRIRREEQLPVFEKLGEVRERAVTLRKIADILIAKGDLDGGLKLLKSECVPAAENLGHVADRAVYLVVISDVLEARGELDEALRIRREEALPVYEKLGHVRERAKTLGKIADVLLKRGELDEALLTLNDEVVPAFEKLGDVRSRAVTLGKIADVLEARGELDEALRIRHEEQLPVYEKLGDVQGQVVCRAKIGIALIQSGKRKAVEEGMIDFLWALKMAQHHKLREAAQLEQILRQMLPENPAGKPKN